MQKQCILPIWYSLLCIVNYTTNKLQIYKQITFEHHTKIIWFALKLIKLNHENSKIMLLDIYGCIHCSTLVASYFFIFKTFTLCFSVKNRSMLLFDFSSNYFFTPDDVLSAFKSLQYCNSFSIDGIFACFSVVAFS